jgi:hypothetical protein
MPRRIRDCVALVALGVLSTSALLGQTPISPTAEECSDQPPEHYMTHVGERYSWTLPLRLSSVTDVVAGDLLTRYFRVRIGRIADAPADWRLTLYDAEGRYPLQLLGPKDMDGSSYVWSRRLPGGRAKALLRSNFPVAAPFLRIDALILARQKPTGVYYSVEQVGREKWQYLLCPQGGADPCQPAPASVRALGESVGMIMLSYKQTVWTCSGFLVAPDLFMTNWHCGGDRDTASDAYWDQDVLRSAIIDFSWDGDGLSNEYGFSGALTDGKPVIKDRDADYALFRVHPLQQSIGPPPILRFRQNAALAAGTDLDIIHHPLSRIKHLTREGCRVKVESLPSWFDKVEGVDFGHTCDTEGGSSGAPVLDRDGNVVGMHHSGYTKDGSGRCDKTNKAVKIDSILRRLPTPLREEILHWQAAGNDAVAH